MERGGREGREEPASVAAIGSFFNRAPITPSLALRGAAARRDSIRFAPTDFQNRRRPRTADASSEDVLTETMFMLSFKRFEESA